MATRTPNTAALAKKYVDLGWEPLLVPYREKSPAGKWKEPQSWDHTKIDQTFGGQTNIGIALGKRSQGLTDLDFDVPLAAQLADIFLPDTWVFGRETNRASHRLCVSDVEKSTNFQVPDSYRARWGFEKGVLLEVRCNGAQTVFPGSTHTSGEAIEWETWDPKTAPPIITGDLLKRLCGYLAASVVFAAAYPKGQGSRDEVCFAMAGTLARTSLDDDTINALVVRIAELAGDEEAHLRSGKVAAAREAMGKGESVYGLPELCKKLGIEDLETLLRKWLGGGQSSNAMSGPTVLIQSGQEPRQIDEIEQILLASDVPVYQRNGTMVRIATIPEDETNDGVTRSQGALQILEVSALWLEDKFASLASWVVHDGEHYQQRKVPAKIAQQYLARVGEWRLPLLKGIVNTPTLRRDGTVLQQAGYDERSMLFFDPGAETFAEIPENPSKEDAETALVKLRGLFREFPFRGPEDEAVAIAFTLTALIRRNLPTAPFFGVSAPTPGTGKTYLVTTAMMIALGTKPSVTTQGGDDEEMRKRIESMLRTGDAVAFIDNAVRPIGGDAICATITSSTIQPRILGKSEMMKLPTNITLCATGNNLRFLGDMTRRALLCELVLQDEFPEHRVFKFDPLKEARKNRGDQVAAGLTILRAYLAANSPNKLPPLAGFQEWCLIREALMWLGMADPLETQKRLVGKDDRRNELRDVFSTWYKTYGGTRKTAREIEREAATDSPRGSSALASALADATGKDRFSTRSVGKWLSGNIERRVDGFMLFCDQDSSNGNTYRVVRLDEDDVPDTNEKDVF